jgi:uncharacterized membrane protein
MNWAAAITATVVSYTLFSYFGLRTGETGSFRQAVLLPFRNPLDFALVMLGSAAFGVATFYALKTSSYAIPVVISIGLVVSFVFSTLFADGRVTIMRLAGLALILSGVWLMK